MTTFVDPRVRMRDALLRVVRAAPDTWREPSMAVFRNRLLDETGSDARPLADLLIEAEQRGWHALLPRDRLRAPQWDALSVPFVMRWSAERFIQADMAQWAAESWALAFDVIAPEQLRVLPPTQPRPFPVSSAGSPASPSAARPSATAASRTASTVQTTMARALRSRGASGARPAGGASPAYRSTRSSGIPMLDPRVVWGLAAAAALAYVGFLGRIAWAVHTSKATAVSQRGVSAADAPTTAKADSSGTRPAAAIEATKPTDVASRPWTALNMPPRPAEPPEQSRPGPGVPGLTSGLLGADLASPSRTMNVEPARRAVGRSVPLDLPPLPTSLTYDEVFLTDGTSMRGRVEIVRAGSVIFRDTRTGLRHDLRKDDIDRIITEFGTPVRFRAAGAAPGALEASAARKRAESGPRARGVSGAYTLRYGEAKAVGSPECLSVWNRPTNVVDHALVRHRPGADTLSVAFDGGDTFPSNIDADGYFASTFRIVPNQARTSTALTTRLTGQFLANGDLALQVNIVFYRRLRGDRDITCAVTIPGRGTAG